jgi:GTP cyclohydrolase I
MQEEIRKILVSIGEDPEREGLKDTPKRVEKAMKFLTKGYGESVEEVIGTGIFEEGHKEMIIVKDIEVYSLCEHHMLPFVGRVHVGYIPDGKIIGLSKIAKIADIFARRLQVQERLTSQIADAITKNLRPVGVGVIIEAEHFCMMMRGVEKQSSKTITSSMRGSFMNDQKTREEFLSLVLRK